MQQTMLLRATLVAENKCWCVDAELSVTRYALKRYPVDLQTCFVELIKYA